MEYDELIQTSAEQWIRKMVKVWAESKPKTTDMSTWIYVDGAKYEIEIHKTKEAGE